MNLDERIFQGVEVRDCPGKSAYLLRLNDRVGDWYIRAIHAMRIVKILLPSSQASLQHVVVMVRPGKDLSGRNHAALLPDLKALFSEDRIANLPPVVISRGISFFALSLSTMKAWAQQGIPGMDPRFDLETRLPDGLPVLGSAVTILDLLAPLPRGGGPFLSVPTGLEIAMLTVRAEGREGLRTCRECHPPHQGHFSKDFDLLLPSDRPGLHRGGYKKVDLVDGTPFAPPWPRERYAMTMAYDLCVLYLKGSYFEPMAALPETTNAQVYRATRDGEYSMYEASVWLPPTPGDRQHAAYLLEQGPIGLTDENMAFLHDAIRKAATVEGAFDALDPRCHQCTESTQRDPVMIIAETAPTVRAFLIVFTTGGGTGIPGAVRSLGGRPGCAPSNRP